MYIAKIGKKSVKIFSGEQEVGKVVTSILTPKKTTNIKGWLEPLLLSVVVPVVGGEAVNVQLTLAAVFVYWLIRQNINFISDKFAQLRYTYMAQWKTVVHSGSKNFEIMSGSQTFYVKHVDPTNFKIRNAFKKVLFDTTTIKPVPVVTVKDTKYIWKKILNSAELEIRIPTDRSLLVNKDVIVLAAITNFNQTKLRALQVETVLRVVLGVVFPLGILLRAYRKFLNIKKKKKN